MSATTRTASPAQRAAVAQFAKSAGYEIVAEYSDDGAKGRPGRPAAGFRRHAQAHRLERRQNHPGRDRQPLRQDLITQETDGFLRDAGVVLIAADSPAAALRLVFLAANFD